MEEEKYLKDFQNLMLISGQWMKFDSKFKKILQKIRSLFFICIWPFVLISVYLGGSKDPSIIGMCDAGLLICFQAHLFAFKWPQSYQLIQKFKKIIQKRNQNDLNIYNKETQKCWKMIRIYRIYTIIFILCGVILPYFVDIYLYMRNLSKPFAVLRLYVLDNGEYRSLKFYCVNFITSLWFFQYIIILYGFESFGYATITYICVEMSVIKKKIKNFNHDLKSIVDDHKRIMGLSEDLKYLLGLPFLTQNVLGALACTFHMYTAITSYNNDIILACVNIFLYVLGFNVMFFTGHMGQRLQDESLSIMDALYDLPWYEMDIKMRRDVLFMLGRAQKPALINFMGIGNLNHMGFMHMLHASYSYFMVVSSKA